MRTLIYARFACVHRTTNDLVESAFILKAYDRNQSRSAASTCQLNCRPANESTWRTPTNSTLRTCVNLAMTVVLFLNARGLISRSVSAAICSALFDRSLFSRKLYMTVRCPFQYT